MSSGRAAVVERRGAEEAGAIFIVVDRLNGLADLYSPAPQSDFEEAQPSARQFRRVAESESLKDIGERLRSEERFDPDLWIVTVEDRAGVVDLM